MLPHPLYLIKYFPGHSQVRYYEWIKKIPSDLKKKLKLYYFQTKSDFVLQGFPQPLESLFIFYGKPSCILRR